MMTNTLIQSVKPVDLTGVRIMGAPSRVREQNQTAHDRLMARIAQRSKLDLPPIQA